MKNLSRASILNIALGRVGPRVRAGAASMNRRGLASSAASAQHSSHDASFPRVEITPFDLGRVLDGHVNRPAIDRRVAELGGRRTVKKQWQAAWLLRAITMIDLTTLAGDDTPGNVSRLCAKARNPVGERTLQAIAEKDGLETHPFSSLQCAAVCVYPARVEDAARGVASAPKKINVASVATGFPSGQIRLEQKLDEIRHAVEDGADEIDIVISRDMALRQEWARMYDEVCAFREACGHAHMKTILATGELPTLRDVRRASEVCMQAGADFIKTSTGKETTNANLAVSLVMLRAIREHYERTGMKVGFKPAGGIATSKQALSYLALVKEELGDEWLQPELFRFGASSLLLDIERQLHHYATGEYANQEWLPSS